MNSRNNTQWKHPCDCSEEVARQRKVNPWVRMHSQVSKRTAKQFKEEGRVKDGVSKRDLLNLLDESKERGGSLIVCNVCGSVKIVDTDEDKENKVVKKNE